MNWQQIQKSKRIKTKLCGWENGNNRNDTPLNLKWTKGEVESLGIYVGNDRKKASQITFNEIKDKIKNKISYWNNKSISLKGKVKI